MKTLIAAALVALTSSAHAVEIPDTPAGRALAMWLNATNAGDEKKLQAYIDTYHRKSTVKDYLYLHQVLGQLTPLKIEMNEPNHVIAVLGEEKFDDALRSEFKTDPKDPRNLVFAQSAGTDRPEDVAIPRLTRDEALKAMQARAETAAAQDKFMGAVLIEDHGKILLEKAWGYGDREKKIPLKVTDKFRLGSMNKMFTAVSTLQLVGQGKLSLDGTVGQYLPDYPNKDIANKVTIRMLLTHTGGTGDIFGDDFDKHRLELKTLDDYVRLYGARAPEGPPGTNSYSNYGFILLGVIIEKVSGEDYYDYVRDHIYKPAGMTDSGSLPETDNVPGRVIGYTADKDGKWVPNTDTLPWRGTSAGGGYSTLGDLLKFAHAMMDGKLLPNDLRDAATRSETQGDWYGYGFELHGTGLAHNYGHTGGAPGMATEMRIYPNVKVVTIELSNIDPGAPAMGAYYANRMPREP
jgi:CubicO group peptidase (beta-lactamase class C family)